MSIIVQKFGGTSVATTDKILLAARKAIQAQQEGHQVVMVVSAMGKNTDALGWIDHRSAESDSRLLARTLAMLTAIFVPIALLCSFPAPLTKLERLQTEGRRWCRFMHLNNS